MDRIGATLLRRRDLLRIIGLDQSTLWRWRKAGTFPAPVKNVAAQFAVA